MKIQSKINKKAQKIATLYSILFGNPFVCDNFLKGQATPRRFVNHEHKTFEQKFRATHLRHCATSTHSSAINFLLLFSFRKFKIQIQILQGKTSELAKTESTFKT
jgi:hypothetical protein